MQCNYPLILENPYRQVPCGRCMACRIRRTQEWAVRLMHESSMHEKSAFVTLTYSPETVPAGNSLIKKDFQLFMKRLRRDLGDRRIKYFACGEYGEHTKRPHYHAIVFGISQDESDLIYEAWPFGFIKMGSVTFDSCRYVAGYIQKKLSGPMAEEEYVGKEAPFQVCSQGLGLSWAMANANYIFSNLNITVRGVPVGIPRYYVKKLEVEAEDFIQGHNETVEKRIAEKVKRGIEWLNVSEYETAARRQREETLKAKQALRKRPV